MTQTPTATATPRSTPRPTRTPPPVISPSPVPTPTAPAVTVTPEQSASPAPSATPVVQAPSAPTSFGPADGRLEHLATGDYAEEFSTGVEVADFIVSSTFINPFDSTARRWNYGYWLRVTETDGLLWSFGFSFPAKIYDGLLIVINGSSEWQLIHRRATVADQGSDIVDTLIASGNVPRISRQIGETNRVTVAAFGDTGWLMVNGDLVAELDLSAATAAGDVRAVTGVFTDDEFNLSFTGFEGLTVSEGMPLEASTNSGGVRRLPDGSEETIVDSLDGNFVFSTVVQAPTPLYSGSWSWSVAVEGGESRAVLVVDSQRRVILTLETVVDGQVTSRIVANAVFTGIGIEPNAPNTVRVIMDGETLGFMVNGQTLPTVQIETGDGRSIALSAYVREELFTADRPVNYSEVQLWRADVPVAALAEEGGA